MATPAKLARELQELEKPIFDPNFEPMLTFKNPPNGEDPLLASANNLYQGVSLIDLKDFAEEYPLNSRLVKKNGKLVEKSTERARSTARSLLGSMRLSWRWRSAI